jgi:hypothetical protein
MRCYPECKLYRVEVIRARMVTETGVAEVVAENEEGARRWALEFAHDFEEDASCWTKTRESTEYETGTIEEDKEAR